MGDFNLEEELERRSRLVVIYAKEIDYKNGKLWDMGRMLEEKDELLKKYIGGSGEMQCIKEENKKLKYELESRSHKELEARTNYEAQLQSITEENKKLKYDLDLRSHKELEGRSMYELQLRSITEENKKLKHELDLRSHKEVEGRSKYELQLRSITEENKKLKYELDLRSHKELEGRSKYELQLQSITEENKKFKHELDLRSHKEVEGRSKYELQLRSITEENQKLKYELDLRSHKELEGRSKYELQLRSITEENQKLKYELDLRSHKELEGRSKYEHQLQSITEENEKLNRKLAFNNDEIIRRVKSEQDLFLELKKLKNKVKSETDEFESRFIKLEKYEKVTTKEKLEKMENRAKNAEKESMLLKKQLEEHDSRLNKCLQEKKEEEEKLLETTRLVNKLQLKLNDTLETIGGRANKAEKESMLLKEKLEELQRRLNECLNQKNDSEKELSSFKTQNNILVKQLREELRTYEYELQEARNLKSASCGKIELLKEKMLVEEGNREKTESELLKLSNIQLHTKKLEDELSSWKMMITKIPGVTCADDILSMFVALQTEVAGNMVKLHEANSHLKQEEELEELKTRLSECLHQKNDLDKNFSCFKTANNLVVKQLREELRDYESELQEARKLKSSFDGNLESLKEKLLEEKNNRKSVELELQKLSEIQLRAKGLEDELCSWKTTIQAIPGVSCAADIPVKFAALQKELAEVSKANANLKQMEEHQNGLRKILDKESKVQEHEEGHREKAKLNLLKSSEIQKSAKRLCSRKMALEEFLPDVSCTEDMPPKFAALQKEVAECLIKAGEASVDLEHLELLADSAILNALPGTELVEAHRMIEETVDIPIVEMAEGVVQPGAVILHDTVTNTELVEVPIFEIKGRWVT